VQLLHHCHGVEWKKAKVDVVSCTHLLGGPNRPRYQFSASAALDVEKYIVALLSMIWSMLSCTTLVDWCIVCKA
jgi:hypothetical protein